MRGKNVVVGCLLMLLLMLGAGCGTSGGGGVAGGSGDLVGGNVKNCAADASCFEQYFTQCNPANRVSEVKSMKYEYTILEKSGSKCKVETKVTASSLLPQLVGKSSICVLDNSKSFQTAQSEAMSGKALSGV